MVVNINVEKLGPITICKTANSTMVKNVSDEPVCLTADLKPTVWARETAVYLEPGETWTKTYLVEEANLYGDFSRFSDDEIDNWVEGFKARPAEPEPIPQKKGRYIDLKGKK